MEIIAIAEILPWATLFRDLAVGISTATAAYFGTKGINAWRRELKGKSEYQLAKSVLKMVYKVRENFDHVRNPAIFQYEYPTEFLNEYDQILEGKHTEANAAVYENRFKKLREPFLKLEELLLDAMVEWGKEHQAKIFEFRRCRSDLILAVRYATGIAGGQNPKDKYDDENYNEHMDILYVQGVEIGKSKFENRLDDSVKKFEDWLRPHVK